MRPDLIITWIKHCDYPIFRGFLTSNRDWFNKVIVLFSEHNRFPYFDHFIHESLKDLNITWFDPAEIDWGREDWRNVSTNEMLKHSDSEWVCSIEQDWFSKDWNGLWEKTKEAMGQADLVGWWQENNKYIHPSYWFIKREMLEKTNKDFAAHDGHDHFGWITKDVERLGGKIITTQEMGFKDFEDCFHLGGVNQNYLEGLKPNYVFHRPEIFASYNYWSLKAEVKQDPRHIELCKKIMEKLPHKPEVDKWKEFFK